MEPRFPQFKSQFLDRLCREFERRSKSIRHKATFTFETKQPDEFEWLALNCRCIGGPYVVFQFVEDNRVSVYIRSSGRRDRGKVLFALEGLSVVGNSEAIVLACKDTLDSSYALARDLEDSGNADRIRSIWRQVAVKIAPS